VAATIEQATGVSPDLVPGGRGEFTVWVGDRKVAEKTRRGFPSEADVVSAVKAALEGGPA
jgi:hypothetical protein